MRAVRALLLAALAGSADAATRTFPGPTPCNGTLQACLDGADGGDRIEIANATPIDETLSLRQSVTLTGAPGVTPVIGGGATMRFVRIQPSPGTPTFVLQGLVVDNGVLVMNISTGAEGTRVEVIDCSVTNTQTAAVRIYPDVPADVTVRGSRLTGGPDYVADVITSPASGELHLALTGNRLTSGGTALAGVTLDLRGGGTTTVHLESNVIDDVALEGLLVFTSDTVAATVNVVNNTIHRALHGLAIRTPEAGATLALSVFNNTISQTTEGAVVIAASSPQLTVAGGFNNLFANGMADELNGYSLGLPLLAVDPLFVDAAAFDYRLQAASPLVDAGGTPPGGLPAVDADGYARLAGAAVDIGAYELGSSPPTSTTTSTSTTSTTSTTLATCATGASFASVRCRLENLVLQVQAGVPAGKLATRLGRLATTARDAAARAETLAGQGKTKPTRKALGKTLGALRRFARKLGSRKAAALDAAVRDTLGAAADALQADVAALRTLRSP